MTKCVSLRGGSWCGIPWGCRSACRFWFHPDIRSNSFGFRVCCPAPKSGEVK